MKDGWGEMTELIVRLGGEPPLDETGLFREATADDVYDLCLSNDAHAMRSGFYQACSLFFTSHELVELSQLQGDAEEWRTKAREIIANLRKGRVTG